MSDVEIFQTAEFNLSDGKALAKSLQKLKDAKRKPIGAVPVYWSPEAEGEVKRVVFLRVVAAFIVAEWLLGVQSVLAQNYPVQSTVQLAPPYSTYLADYVAPGTNRLSINVLLTELDRVEYPVKLRVTIEGGGVTLRTHDRYAPAPITLQGGMLEMLTAVDLAPYFDPMNLQFSGGLRSDQFQRTGQLPEGFYRFCVEVLDYNSGTVVSNTGCASAWLILNEPPLINLPQADSKVRAQEPPNLIFQWTPRHLGSPNAAFTTEYELTLVELWPANRNPNDAVLSTVPLFQTSTTSTTYVYSMADPPLEPGRRYAFRVQARSMTGLEALDLFKNQGYSEVVSFTYGDACTLPTRLTATPLSATRLKLSWQTSLVHTGYTVRYREASSRTSRWVEETSYLDALTLSGLKPNTEYEYQLQSLCGTISGDYSPVATIRTLPREDNPMVCGLPSPALDLGNSLLLEYLYPGDYLYAGDFDVQVTEVQTGAAGFSGSGIAEMPLLNLARVRVAFNNIQVNTDYRVIAGNVYSLSDPTEGGVLSLDEQGPVALDEQEDQASKQRTATINTTITVAGEIAQVYVNKEGQVVAVDTGGQEEIVADEVPQEGLALAVEDSQGNSFTVDSGGVSQVGADQANLSANITNHASELTGLDSLVARIISEKTQQSKASLDNLLEDMQPFIQKIEGIIETEQFYPPRIRGLNDELISEGISLYIGIIDKPEAVKARLSPSVLAIDEARNELVKLDMPVQQFKAALEVLAELKEGEPFQQFVQSIRTDTEYLDSLNDRIQYIEEAIEQTISKNNEDE